MQPGAGDVSDQVVLGAIGSTECVLAVSHTPWVLPIDVLVVSVGAAGFGRLGNVVASALPRTGLRAVDPGQVTPTRPTWVTVRDPGFTLTGLVLASVRDPSPDTSVEGPATPDAVEQATLSSLELAASHGARSVGLPILGAGLAGLPDDVVAERIVAAVRSTLDGRGGLERVVLFTNDPEARAPLLQAWGRGPAGTATFDTDRPSEDAPLGCQVGEPWTGHEGRVFWLAVSPDGSRVFSAGGDGTVRAWDAQSGRPVGTPWTGHVGEVYSVAVSPDGSRVFSSGADGTVLAWDPGSGRPVGRAWTGHGAPVCSVAVSPDGSTVFSAGDDGTVRAWDADGGGRVWRSVEPSDELWSVAVSPDGTRVFAGRRDGAVLAFEAGSGRRIGEDWTGHDDAVEAVVVSPDGSRVFSSSRDATLRAWEADTGRPVGDPWLGHRGIAWSVAVSPDGRRVVSGGSDGTLRVWEPHDGRALGAPWVGHREPVSAVAVSRDGTRLFTASHDSTVRAWAWYSEPPLPQPVHRYAGVRSDVASPEDRLGMDADATTMAALLAAVDTRPPLSVALMGNWGSGKSTFMLLVRMRVAALARDARANPGGAYASDVRQVVFNAWHYSDDHLWVGLVEHLFRELRDQDPDPAAAADDRVELEARLAEQKARQARLDERLRQVDALDPARGWWGWVGQLRRSTIVLRAAGAEARLQWRRALWAASALLLLGVGLLVAVAVVGDLVDGWLRGLGGLAGVGALVGAIGARVVAPWRIAGRFTEKARSRLLTDRAGRADEIDDLEQQLTERDPARQLDRLLDEITDPERYSSYRGLVGRIHHDLRRLDEQLADAREHDRRALRRIILYVDDLDRCASHRVVEVLQAVNLLLSMDLFVVVVAVDPRWLLRALDEHHGRLLNARGTVDDDGYGRPLDYLDKIFHVPYAVRPMREHAGEFLRHLLPAVTSDPEPAGDTPAVAPPAATPRAGVPDAPSTDRGEILTGLPPSAVDAEVEATSRPSGMRPPTPAPDVRSLELTPREAEFLPRLAGLVPTPRGIKKLANTYRLLRISIPDDRLDGFLGRPDQGGPYQVAALLLAAVMSRPGHARELLEGLHACDPDQDIVESLASADGPLCTAVVDLVSTARAEGVVVCGSTRIFQTWAGDVARYSFDTYDLFTGEPGAALEVETPGG